MADHVQDIMDRLGPREVIGQAVDLLMTQDDVSRDAAFEELVQQSSGSHRGVRETAAEIIAQRSGD